MSKNIELYLVSGFLGSGKTTFLQEVLKCENSTGKVGVIVNEFGSIGIDGKIIDDGNIKLVEINNGSIFCACLKDGFVKTLAAFLQQPIEKLYVEASGMADPSSIEQLLAEIEPLILKKYNTDRRYDYKGCICIVDCGHFIELKESLMSPVLQVKKSNLVVLNKIDTVSEDAKHKVLHIINDINPNAVVYCTSYAKVPEEIILSSLGGETITTSETTNTTENRPYGAVIILKDTYEYVRMVSFFRQIAAKLYRIKGFFKTQNGSFYVSGVGSDVQFTKTVQKEDVDCKIVLIGTATPGLTLWISDVWNEVFHTSIEIEEDVYCS